MENKIKSLLQSRDYAEIVRIASDMDVNEAATLFSQFDEEVLVQVLSLFDDEKLGEFLPEFDKDTQNLVVTRLNQKKLQSVMDEISAICPRPWRARSWKWMKSKICSKRNAIRA